MPTLINFPPGTKEDTWYKNQNEDREKLKEQTLLWTFLLAAQMVIYYNLWKDVVEKRDAVIDDMEEMLTYLHDKDMNVDYPMMKKKQEVLDLALPEVDLCGDAILCSSDADLDGKAIDSLATHLAKADCCGSPWETTEGQLYAARAGDYAGGILANSAKRRQEEFRKNKTRLVLKAQATARMAAAPILGMYQQSMGIYEGLAGVYLQGFTSAGAGLGVNLQRLGGNNATGVSTVAGGSV